MAHRQADNIDPYNSQIIHGANMGSIWGRQDPGGPHIGPMNFAIWVCKHDNGKIMFKTMIHKRNEESLLNNYNPSITLNL